ncbi:hypothetical protein V6N13_043422 [Hibiscus sabdariffa]
MDAKKIPVAAVVMYMYVAKESSPRRIREAKEREQSEVITGALNLVSFKDLQIMCLREKGFSPAWIFDAISMVAVVLKRSRKWRVPDLLEDNFVENEEAEEREGSEQG